MTDRSSRPHLTRPIPEESRNRIVALRHEWMTVRQVARVVAVGTSTVARICKEQGLSRLTQLEPPVPAVRYEWKHPGELIHLDVKRLGRFNGVGHRITRQRSYGKRDQGFEYVHVATDDASRLCFVEILPDESAQTATAFLINAIDWLTRFGVVVKRVMTDNGPGYRSDRFAAACLSRNIRHLRTKPYTPRTNGKVERFIQTLLREWAYRFSYSSSNERKRWLRPFLHFYNYHRAHSALAYNPPISRLDRNNVVRRNS